MTVDIASLRPLAAGLVRPSAGGVYLLLSAVLVGTMLVQMPVAELRLDTGAFLIRPWDIAWLLVLLASVPLLVRRTAMTRPMRNPTTPVGLFVGFTLVAVLSLSWGYATFRSENFAECVIRAGRYASVCVLAMVLTTLGSPRWRRGLVGAFLVTAVVAAGLASLSWATESRVASDTGAKLGVTRAGGPFGNFFADGTADVWWAAPAAPNDLGLWLAVAAVTTVGSLADAFRTRQLHLRRSLALLLMLGVVLLGLAATHSRESWLACAVGTAVVVWVRMARGRTWQRWVLYLSLIGSVAAAVYYVPTLNARVADTFRPGSFAYESGPRARFDAWDRGIDWTVERFPIGWGLGEIEENPQYFGSTTAENVYLQVAATVGVLGAALLVLVLFVGARDARRRLRAGAGGPGAYFPLAFFVVFAVHGLFGNTLGNPTVQILLAIALGLVAGSAWWTENGTSSLLKRTDR